MNNAVQCGNTINLTAPYTVTSGQGAVVGNIFGVACGDVTSGATGEFEVVGVFDLPKDGVAFTTVGALVYWGTAARLCHPSSSGGVIIGVNIATATAGDATVRVRLNGAFGI